MSLTEYKLKRKMKRTILPQDSKSLGNKLHVVDKTIQIKKQGG